MIRFDFSYALEIVGAILALLVQASPYAGKRSSANPPTHYRDEHAIFIDGAEVTALPQQIPANAEVVLVNLQPYARKIERGLSLQAPHGVYEVVARLAKRRFGNAARISFGYRMFPGAGPGGPAAHRGGTASKAQDDSFPAITINARVGEDGANDAG